MTTSDISDNIDMNEPNGVQMRLLQPASSTECSKTSNNYTSCLLQLKDELFGIPSTEKERNKIAMKTKREYDTEYRMRENHRNKIAMRLKREQNYEYRLREKQRNKIAMQMRRKREKEKVVEIAQELPVEVEIHGHATNEEESSFIKVD